MQQWVTERQRFRPDHWVACRQRGQAREAYAEAQCLPEAQLHPCGLRLMSPAVGFSVLVDGLARPQGLIDALEHPDATGC